MGCFSSLNACCLHLFNFCCFWLAQGYDRDLILLVTERHQFCVLSYDSESNEIVTEAKGDVRVRDKKIISVSALSCN